MKRLPDHRTVTRAQGRHTASKSTTRVVGIDCACFLPRSCRNKNNPVVHGGRTRQTCCFVVLDTLLPIQLACLRVERIYPADLVSEHKRPPRSFLYGNCRRADGSVCLEQPVNASGIHIQRVNSSRCASQVKSSIENRRRGKSRHVVCETESPFEFQIGNLRACESRAGSPAGSVHYRTPDSNPPSYRSQNRPPAICLHRRTHLREAARRRPWFRENGLPLRAHRVLVDRRCSSSIRNPGCGEYGLRTFSESRRVLECAH